VVTWQTGGMVPPAALLPDVLPTDRLTDTGVPTPEVRTELRRISTIRGALTVLGVWAQVVGVLVAAAWLSHPLTWILAFALMGRSFALLAILGHEAAHRLLFPGTKLNDFVGRWLAYYPSFTPYDAYRRAHMAHHRVEFGPSEPDMNFYSGFPAGWASVRRKLARDIFGITGLRNLAPLFGALSSSRHRFVAVKILAAQGIIFGVFAAFGRPGMYLLLWLLPWLTIWKVFNRLRAVAEHGGMHQSIDRRQTTHHVRQSFSSQFWIAPLKTGWHLAHHVDSGVPFRNLPKLQRELEQAGYCPPELIWPSYRALWLACVNGRSDVAD
jgi:fatty acid desaturase